MFVSDDWDLRLEEAYRAHADNPDLALVSATIPNNGLGSWRLLDIFPELREQFLALPHAEWTDHCAGPVWFYPHLAEWMIRHFLDMREANARLRAAVEPQDRFVAYHDRFSINCIAYDYRHWLELGGVREHDEVDWGTFIRDNHKLVVLDFHALVHHYTFFNQQDWLDRTSLLEDLRRANVSGSLPFYAPMLSHLRFLRQAPQILGRRLGKRQS